MVTFSASIAKSKGTACYNTVSAAALQPGFVCLPNCCGDGPDILSPSTSLRQEASSPASHLLQDKREWYERPRDPSRRWQLLYRSISYVAVYVRCADISFMQSWCRNLSYCSRAAWGSGDWIGRLWMKPTVLVIRCWSSKYDCIPRLHLFDWLSQLTDRPCTHTSSLADLSTLRPLPIITYIRDQYSWPIVATQLVNSVTTFPPLWKIDMLLVSKIRKQSLHGLHTFEPKLPTCSVAPITYTQCSECLLFTRS